jgi:hypothetical protein
MDRIYRCSGLIMANAIISYYVTADETVLDRAYKFLNRSAHAKYKALYGKVPEGDLLITIDERMNQEMRRPVSHYGERDNKWDTQTYKEIIECYDEMADFMLNDDTNALTEQEVNVTIFLGVVQAGLLADRLEKLRSE